jgi:hypothetical protein
VGRLDTIALLQIGDGARHLENAVVGAGRQTQMVDRPLQEFFALLVDRTVAADVAGGHMGVAEQLGMAFEAGQLSLTGSVDPFAYRGGRLAGRLAHQVVEGDSGDLHVEIDPVEEGAGDTRPVALDRQRRAGAFVMGIAQIAAGTGIHGGDEHELGRIGEGDGRPGDGDGVVFERLAQRFDDMVAELGEFVEKEDAVVGQGDLTGAGIGAPADEPGVGDGVLMGGRYFTFLIKITIRTDFYSYQVLSYDSEFDFKIHSLTNPSKPI